MIRLVEILLGLAAAWALVGHIVACGENLRANREMGMPSGNARRAMCLNLIAFVVALGFLGLLLK